MKVIFPKYPKFPKARKIWRHLGLKHLAPSLQWPKGWSKRSGITFSCPTMKGLPKAMDSAHRIVSRIRILLGDLGNFLYAKGLVTSEKFQKALKPYKLTFDWRWSSAHFGRSSLGNHPSKWGLWSHLLATPRKSKDQTLPIGKRILYMDHPKDHSLFGLGLSGYSSIKSLLLIANLALCPGCPVPTSKKNSECHAVMQLVLHHHVSSLQSWHMIYMISSQISRKPQVSHFTKMSVWQHICLEPKKQDGSNPSFHCLFQGILLCLLQIKDILLSLARAERKKKPAVWIWEELSICLTVCLPRVHAHFVCMHALSSTCKRTMSFQALGEKTKKTEEQTNMNGGKGHHYSFCAVTQGETGVYMPREMSEVAKRSSI